MFEFEIENYSYVDWLSAMPEKIDAIIQPNFPVEFLTAEMAEIICYYRGSYLKYFEESKRTLSACRRAVMNDGGALRYVPQKYLMPVICFLACQNDGLALEWAPLSLKTIGLCKAAVNNNIAAIKFVPKYLKEFM